MVNTAGSIGRAECFNSLLNHAVHPLPLILLNAAIIRSTLFSISSLIAISFYSQSRFMLSLCASEVKPANKNLF
jgi:hypothetical protein